jgi:hypothetical protein
MSTDPDDVCSKSPLLLGTCILAGLHSIPTLHGSQTHHTLYRHVHGLLGRAHLASAASLDTIQAMLIFSMWDLRPTRDHDHGNSWLLSGMAAMQVVMTTRFDQLLYASSASEATQSRELIRTWNLICLCQLQYVSRAPDLVVAFALSGFGLTASLDFQSVLDVHPSLRSSTSINVPKSSSFLHTIPEMNLYLQEWSSIARSGIS